PPAFTFLDWDGGPRLEGCAASVGCSTHAVHDGGDHWIVIGKVVALHRTTCASPLIFHGSRYANLGTTFESEILVSGF
ncbi:MAG TPA: flavin reductase family protein, partial [Vicinamibacterales bacterium]|nr:flavin reductase family protein [Vicinamibacterales bacterium]